MKALYDSFERVHSALLASEDWASTYANAPEQHAKLIKTTAKVTRELMVYFKHLSQEVSSFIDWYAYARAVIENKSAMKSSNIEAYDVNVIVNQNATNQESQQFIQIIFDSIATATALGAQSMELEAITQAIKRVPVSMTETSTIVQQLTTEQLANLVGMKVDKETGTIVPNPNAEMNVDETTRNKIAQSIKTSIQLGENQKQAIARLQSIIADPKRADMIARTETVRAYATGRNSYAKASGAVAKHWYDSNAIDICSDNTFQGWIPVDQDFISGDPFEPAHPNCKCQTLYSYDPEDLILS